MMLEQLERPLATIWQEQRLVLLGCLDHGKR
jgi:hypothetical protein